MSGTTTSGSAAVFHQPLSRLSVPNSGRASIPTGSSSPAKDEAGQAPLPLRVTSERQRALTRPGSEPGGGADLRLEVGGDVYRPQEPIELLGRRADVCFEPKVLD